MIKKIILVLSVCIISLQAATISTDKNIYQSGENIEVTVGGMSGIDDWIGIYPAGVISDDWEELATWAWTGGIIDGTVTLDGIPAGEYDVRSFFNSSTNEVAEVSISVEDAEVILPPTIYEDAENGISNQWRTITGSYRAKRVTKGFHSKGALKLTTEWISNTENRAFYSLPLNNANQKILEMDIGGVGRSGGKPGGRHNAPAGYMPHFSIGVTVVTEQGDRTMTWDSFFNHENVDPFREDYGGGSIELLYPSPVEHVRGYSYERDINKWEHFRVDLDEYLHMLEPNNKILFVEDLVMGGGFIDNIQLSSN